MVSSRSFIVSGLTLRSLIHFEFIFKEPLDESERGERKSWLKTQHSKKEGKKEKKEKGKWLK